MPLPPPRSSGLPITRPSWPALVPTGGYTSGISPRSGRSRARRTLRTARLNFSSSTEVTRLRSRTSAGTPTTPGSSAASPRTTSCRSGRWRRTSTTTRSQRPRPRSSRTANEENLVMCLNCLYLPRSRQPVPTNIKLNAVQYIIY